MGCFAVSAVVACTTETPMDGPANGASGDNGKGDVVSGGNKAGGTETTTTGLPCDVDKVLKTRCQTCHGSPTQFGASELR